MKVTEFTKSIFIGLMAIIAIVFALQNSQAAPAQTTLVAPVELVSTININSANFVDFGRIVPPIGAGVTETYTVNSDDTTSTQAGGTGEFIPGSASPGNVNITGPLGISVDLSSNANPSGILCVPNDALGTVILTEIKFEELGGPDVLDKTINATGAPQSIAMGGTVSVSNGSTGRHDCTYNVDVVFTP